jgi:RIO kinase 1
MSPSGRRRGAHRHSTSGRPSGRVRSPNGSGVDVPDILRALMDDGVIDDVKLRLMSGKEASVFVVERRGELLAAKVYKSRDQRTFKATASYTEGRNQTRNTRDKRAMGKRTSWGKELAEASWRDMEYQALSEAFSAGVRVPEPVLLYENVLLMELLIDEDSAPAPRLSDFDLPSEVAGLLHKEIFLQVRALLGCGKIHGDLSAFNILIARDGPTLIDMPQVVDAARNNSAPEILRRDLQNVTEHLARFDARLLRFRDCGAALWRHYQRGTLELATEPEEGGVRRGHEGHRGRRHRDAERGRAGRGANDRSQRGPNGAPPQPPGRAAQGAPFQGAPGPGRPAHGRPPSREPSRETSREPSQREPAREPSRESRREPPREPPRGPPRGPPGDRRRRR